jgi:hypothetical protein
MWFSVTGEGFSRPFLDFWCSCHVRVGRHPDHGKAKRRLGAAAADDHRESLWDSAISGKAAATTPAGAVDLDGIAAVALQKTEPAGAVAQRGANDWLALFGRKLP